MPTNALGISRYPLWTWPPCGEAISVALANCRQGLRPTKLSRDAAVRTAGVMCDSSDPNVATRHACRPQGITHSRFLLLALFQRGRLRLVVFESPATWLIDPALRFQKKLARSSACKWSQRFIMLFCGLRSCTRSAAVPWRFPRASTGLGPCMRGVSESPGVPLVRRQGQTSYPCPFHSSRSCLPKENTTDFSNGRRMVGLHFPGAPANPVLPRKPVKY